MKLRITALILCFVFVFTLFGVGCDGKKDSDVAAQNSSVVSDEYYESSEEFTGSEESDEAFVSSSKDEFAFEEAPEDEWYSFPEDTFNPFASSSDAQSDVKNSSSEDSYNEDDFDIETIPSFGGSANNATSSDRTSGGASSSKPSGTVTGSTPSNTVSSNSPNYSSSSKTPSHQTSSSEQAYVSSGESATSVPSEEPKVTYIDSALSFAPLTATGDGLLDNNPDRGYRTELVLYIKEQKSSSDDPRTAYINDSQSQIRKSIEGIFNIYFKNSYSTNKTFLAYIYITDFRDDDISKAAPVLEMFFKICRERKVKSMLRFCYNNSYAKNFELSQENKDLLASECADQETILKHIKQLKPYISKYKDTIHTISCGFVGFVGEWAYHYQYPTVDYPTVMKAIVEELCVPNGLYFSSRSPAYKELLETDYKYRDYISHNNDAMYGEQKNKGWNSGNYQIGQSNGWWEYVTRVAAYTPQDGEMYTNNVLIDRYNMVPNGLQIILECAHHRHTSMSNWHGYLEALSRDNIMSRWIKNETITPEILNANNILYDPNWFFDDNGNSVKRNPYQFLKDHLGYKLTATDGYVKGEAKKGGSLNVKINLKNYGFAAAYMLESGFAVLDSNFKVVSTVKAGDPSKWYSHAPNNSATTTALTHTVSANIKIPSTSDTYYIAFYLKNTMNDAARLSNDMYFKNGCNILFSVKV